MKRVYIEGNVGSGKTTFLNILQKHLEIQALYEPVFLWEHIDGNDLLKQF